MAKYTLKEKMYLKGLVTKFENYVKYHVISEGK